MTAFLIDRVRAGSLNFICFVGELTGPLRSAAGSKSAGIFVLVDGPASAMGLANDWDRVGLSFDRKSKCSSIHLPALNCPRRGRRSVGAVAASFDDSAGGSVLYRFRNCLYLAGGFGA